MLVKILNPARNAGDPGSTSGRSVFFAHNGFFNFHREVKLDISYIRDANLKHPIYVNFRIKFN